MKKEVVVLLLVVICVGAVGFGLRNQSEAKIFLVGDMFFDRQIKKVMYQKGEDFIFSCIGSYLKKADLVVSNLEGPITENASVSLGSVVDSPSNFIFTFPTNTAKLLAKNNVRVVNLGNNHIDNFGKEGIASTKKYLGDAGIEYFGGLGGDEPVLRTKIGGSKISFVSYNQFGGSSSEQIAATIKTETQNDRFVIVYAHWGEEYSKLALHQRNTAKLFAAAGARAIIGSHPHVISSSEKIGETIVYYSLGNFLFDQYWNAEVRTGLLLELQIKGEDVNVVERKVTLGQDGRTCLVNNRSGHATSLVAQGGLYSALWREQIAEQ